MNGIYVTIAETMGTDGEFYSEVYLSKTEEDAKKVEETLIADMADTMDVYDDTFEPSAIKEIGTNDWWYRVRTELQGFYQL
jgi:hypothetical protein